MISCDFMMIFDDFMGFNADLMRYSWVIHGIFMGFLVCGTF